RCPGCSVGSSGSGRTPSDTVLRRQCCNSPVMRAPIAPVALDPTGLPETDALLLIQFFAAGAAIAEMQAPIAPVALDPTGLPETDGSF
ncbi:hypothetical protein, partial [Bacillus amyloliquefaciens]|uniref:hypothetical protein n=1 Tax=Bacillus amyloliquefaciens TaxID=1390 RepID=UPI001C2F2954